MKEYIPYSRSCFVCGEENPYGFRLKFYQEGDAVVADVVIPEHMCGYVGYAHGGVVATLLDEAMSWASSVFAQKKTLYVTGELKVKLRKPVPLGVPLVLKGSISGEKHGVVLTRSHLMKGEKVLAEGSGVFFPAPPSMLSKRAVEIRYERCNRFKNFFDNI